LTLKLLGLDAHLVGLIQSDNFANIVVVLEKNTQADIEHGRRSFRSDTWT
jgi:hypothetical protein